MTPKTESETKYCARCEREITGASHFCSVECALKRHPIAEALARAARFRNHLVTREPNATRSTP